MDVGEPNFRFELDDPEKKARTIRYPKTAELHLDSLDRYNAANVNSAAGIPTISTDPNFLKLWGNIVASSNVNSTNNCLIQTKRNLIYGYMTRVALTQFNLNYDVQTVTAGYNDLIAITKGVTPIFATIPAGYYNVTTLAAQLQTTLRAMTGYGALTVTPPTSQSSAAPLAAPVTTGFAISTGVSPPMAFIYGYTNATADAQLRIARFYRLIGMNRAGAGYGAVPATTPIPNPFDTSIVLWTNATLGNPNFRYTDYVDIVSQALTNYKDTKDANSAILSPGSVIGRIWLTEYPLASQATGTLGWPQDGMWGMGPMSFVKNWAHPNWSQWSPNSAINSVDITLLDMFGKPLPWDSTSNSEWSATLTVTE